MLTYEFAYFYLIQITKVRQITMFVPISTDSAALEPPGTRAGRGAGFQASAGGQPLQGP